MAPPQYVRMRKISASVSLSRLSLGHTPLTLAAVSHFDVASADLMMRRVKIIVFV
jgi:hypothetical protein